MSIDDLAKRRFEATAQAIANELNRYEMAVRQLNDAAVMLYILQQAFLDYYERGHGVTAETAEIRDLVQKASNTFTSDQVVPAIDAVKNYFSDSAQKIGEMVGSLPKSP